MESPASFIDHTLLKPTATSGDLTRLCEEAVEYGFAAVCIPPVFVRHANECLYGSGVKVATVVGFPLGYDLTATKCFQTRQAVDSGASEIDMVINLGAAESDDFDLIEKEIVEVNAAAESARLKVIIECCLFDDVKKRKLAELVARSGAAYVKTSTGFAGGGATVEDVRLLAEVVAGRAGVKAAGGIRGWDTCREMIEAGADRIGTSAGDVIMRQWLEARQT